MVGYWSVVYILYDGIWAFVAEANASMQGTKKGAKTAVVHQLHIVVSENKMKMTVSLN